MQLFQPTYLCIKEHSITGLKYLCKTTETDQYLVEEYRGSGKYWKKHLKEHGKEFVETPWYCLFTEKDELVKFALMLSEQMNIVNAKDKNGKKIWANLKPENGLDGGSIKGHKKPPRTKEHTANNAAANKGISRNKGKPGLKGAANGMYGKVSYFRGKRRGAWSDEHRVNQIAAKRGISQEKVECPYCLKVGGISNMKRWHFDNCKLKLH